MQRKGKAYAGLVLALMLGIALSGTPPGALSYVHDSCKDGLDNDVDGTYGGQMDLILADFADGECTWMPYYFGQGEYDGQGLTDPVDSDQDVSDYVNLWIQNWSPGMPSHWDIMKAANDAAIMPQGQCKADVLNALDAYKNTYGLSDDMTGASEHQATCGVSY